MFWVRRSETLLLTERNLNKEKNMDYQIQPRNIALCIIFSIITFGIYGIYWMIKINNDLNTLAG